MINNQVSYDEITKIWSGGPQEHLYDPEMSIGRVLFNRMKSDPENVIQISDSDGTILTSGEALTAAIRIAQHLHKMGLQHDDVVGIMARNTTYLMPLALACFFNCTPFHAVNIFLDEKTIAGVFEESKPKVIFCDGRDYEKVLSISKSLKSLIYTLSEHIEGVARVQDLLKPTEIEKIYNPRALTLGGVQTVAILCSSGTTGPPKAVCLSNNRFIYKFIDVTKEDVIYNPSGIDWISGLIALAGSCFYGCTRLITSEPPSPQKLINLINRHKVTTFFGAPRHVAALIECPTVNADSLASIRLLSVGGSLITQASINAIKKFVPKAEMVSIYGLTECGVLTVNYEVDQSSSVGRLLPGIRARIIDDDGNNLGHNEVGEIIAQHNLPWSGYLHNPAATKKMCDEEGWMHTGDLGFFDNDQRLHIVDRKKDILKFKGFQYWPGEIEQCICELSEVKDACVVGIYDESCGDSAGALVVKVKGSNLSEETVEAYVAEKLVVPHKQLNAGVIFVEELPTNNNGKVTQKEAKKLFLARKAI